MGVKVIAGGGFLLLLGIIFWLPDLIPIKGIAVLDGSVKEGYRLPSIGEPPAQPNVLLITVDTLRADALGVYGHPRNRTPHIDSLAREGAIFLMSLAPVPQTNPSHASIFTGMFPKRHGLFHHMGSLLSKSVKTVAELLAEAGYLTAGHHSWISFDPEFSGLERGFATYQRHTIDRPWPGDRPPDWYEDYMDGRADVTTEAVLQWLGGGASEPFFLWVHYMDPHFPYAPPPPLRHQRCRTSWRTMLGTSAGAPTPWEIRRESYLAR